MKKTAAEIRKERDMMIEGFRRYILPGYRIYTLLTDPKPMSYRVLVIRDDVIEDITEKVAFVTRLRMTQKGIRVRGTGFSKSQHIVDRFSHAMYGSPNILTKVSV